MLWVASPARRGTRLDAVHDRPDGGAASSPVNAAAPPWRAGAALESESAAMPMPAQATRALRRPPPVACGSVALHARELSRKSPMNWTRSEYRYAELPDFLTRSLRMAK